MSTANRAFILSTIVMVSGCSDSIDISRPPAKSAQTTVGESERISFKAFSTGQVANNELKKASEKPLTWTYFGEPRIVKYKALADGTIIEFEFDLKNSWEGYKLRDELEKKFKASSATFRFHCLSKDNSVNFSDKSFSVTDEICYAFDQNQTLAINTRWPKYKDPLLVQFPSLNLLVDRGSVMLYDQNLRTAKAEEERKLIQKRIADDDHKARKDM